ncbi:MAG: PilZ domain-containing protein [Verrucomicrobia bacterium]|nr:PilZ domain-containing protein [Verrucomicrobiota bacterium]
MKERRRHPRFNYDQEVDVTFYSVSGHSDLAGTRFHCHTADISKDGVRLSSSREIAPGTMLELSVAINDPPACFTHVAQVRWVNRDEVQGDFSLGLQFVSSDRHMDEWRNMVRQLRNEFGSDVEPDDRIDE